MIYFDKVVDWMIVAASTIITVLVTVVWGILALMLFVSIWHSLTN